MATNNYFGFTHGGTQYGATGAAAAYQTGQTGYAVGHAAATPGTYTTQRAGTAYDTAYQTAATHTTAGTYAGVSNMTYQLKIPAGAGSAATSATYDYGYGRSTQTAYDGSKTYYQQPAAAATYSAAESHYQASKPAYSTNSTYTSTTRPVTQTTQKTPSYTSGYTSQTTANYTSYQAASQTPSANKAATTYSGYDAALYSAANMYLQQQAQGTATVTTAKPAGTNTWQTFKKGPAAGKQNKPKQPPKPQQLHYCDVCKISCAGPQTYREHLEGQKHKKKEAAAKAGASATTVRGNALCCELCDVTCTGSDAYAAHIRGAKHQKVVKLHTKLGKPIPSTEPVIVSASNKTTTTTSGKTTTSTTTAAKSGAATKTTSATPKITFVGAKDQKTDVKKEEEEVTIPKLPDEKDIQPVGQDYIEEIKNEDGKVISFNCKLCECRFNDPNAKEMHMKGRRHRLQYKKKVNPDLVVDVKPSLRQRKLQEEKLRRQQMREEFYRRREEERMMEEEERMYWEERRRYEEEMEYFEWYRRYGRDPRGMPPPPRPFGPGPMFFPQPMRRPDSSDDRHVIAKHAEIYPKEDELLVVQKIVSNTEKALKLVSDFIAESDSPKDVKKKDAVKKDPEEKKEENKERKAPLNQNQRSDRVLTEKKEAVKTREVKQIMPDSSYQVFTDKKDDEKQPPRVLKGVMRVGVLAKGLLLHGDLSVNLVVLCSEKPTRTLLDRVADCLPKQLANVAGDEKYELKRCVEEAAIVVSSSRDPSTSVTITLTSPVMREQNVPDAGGDSQSQSQAVKDPPDVLDKQKCLDALAALRHAKWFQARAAGLQSCVMVIRILRDLCQRVPTWAPLNSWAMELLVEKVISSAGQPLSPGDALRRVFEALAAGILLPGGPGLHDPCEKDPMDASALLTNQEREDITASAQHALRLIAFRQIHKVLGMDALPTPKFNRGRFSRKRRRDNSNEEGNDSEGGDGKKDKKEEGDSDKMESEKTNSK